MPEGEGAHGCAILCTAAKHTSGPWEDSHCGGSLQDGSIVIHGGYDGQRTFGDTYVLTTSDWTWKHVVTTGKAACHTHNHPHCFARLLHQKARLLDISNISAKKERVWLNMKTFHDLQASTQLVDAS